MAVLYQEVSKPGSLRDEYFGFRKTKKDASADPAVIEKDKRNFDGTWLQHAVFPSVVKAFDAVCTTFFSKSQPSLLSDFPLNL
jgi:hypothetical protein